MAPPKVQRTLTGRGGYHHSTGLAQARRELSGATSDDDTEVEVTNVIRSPKGGRRKASPEFTAEDLCQKAEAGARAIDLVLTRSKNLKGSCLREVRSAVEEILGSVKGLATRTSNEEVRRLSADNQRLRGQLAALGKEVAALRRAFSQRETTPRGSPVGSRNVNAGGLSREEFSSAMERLQRELMSHIGGVIGARLESLEVDGRLLPSRVHRPPLRATIAGAPAQELRAPTPRAPVPRPQKATAPVSSSGAPTTLAPPANLPRQAREVRPKMAPHALPRAEEPVAGPSRQEVEMSWTTVAKKARKGPATKKAPKTPAAPKAPKVPKAPKTLAVVVALKPEAVAEGATYRAALTKARAEVNLGQLGIGPGRFRRSITGACIMELPKETTADQADALAGKMGEVLGAMAKVSRPTKMADIRLVGLDDSVSAEDIKMAVAGVAGCPPEKIRVGNISARGVRMGSVVASIPAEVAAKVIEARRICVGWSAVSIQLMEPLALRCHRCHAVGHARAMCPSSKDRSELCFRCGKEGHLSANCEAPPHCALCADLGRPADHRMKGPKCNPPPVKGRPMATATRPQAKASSTKAAPMDTTPSNAQ